MPDVEIRMGTVSAYMTVAILELCYESASTPVYGYYPFMRPDS